MTSHERIIKKYPNRRLYDTEISAYITLEDIKALVLQHHAFKVVEVDTGKDVTAYILLQIINELEGQHSPIFTTAFLQQMIRFYGNPLQQACSQFLEKSFSWFLENKSGFQHMFEQENPFNSFSELTKKNIALWQNMMGQYFQPSHDKTQHVEVKQKKKQKDDIAKKNSQAKSKIKTSSHRNRKGTKIKDE